jgi:hypothetical protein
MHTQTDSLGALGVFTGALIPVLACPHWRERRAIRIDKQVQIWRRRRSAGVPDSSDHTVYKGRAMMRGCRRSLRPALLVRLNRELERGRRWIVFAYRATPGVLTARRLRSLLYRVPIVYKTLKP